MKESFTYDGMDRLTGITLTRRTWQDLHCSVSYDALGRMTSRQASPSFPSEGMEVTYTGFDKVGRIRQSGDSLRYTYGFDRRRARMEEWRGSLRREKLYVGSCERVTETVAGTTDSRWWTFLVGPGGVYAVVVTEGVSHSVHYILRDHLGSWTMVTDRDGAVEQELSYDAWGNLRDPGTWVNYGSAEGGGSQPMFDRGFTGHEHLSAFGLVNMDGRVYDPVMSCFLSPDLYTPGTADPRSYNRFAYCMHNPLRYVDPSGWRSRQPAPGSTPSTGDIIHEIYAYSEKAYEPRDFGIHPPLMSEIEVVWMEENELHGGGSGIVIKGGWYKQGNRILWSSSFSSQEEMNRQGIDGTYLGHTYVDEKNQIYYSLLGYEIDMTAGNGLAGKIAPLIDESIIAYEQYTEESILYYS